MSEKVYRRHELTQGRHFVLALGTIVEDSPAPTTSTCRS